MLWHGEVFAERMLLRPGPGNDPLGVAGERQLSPPRIRLVRHSPDSFSAFVNEETGLVVVPGPCGCQEPHPGPLIWGFLLYGRDGDSSVALSFFYLAFLRTMQMLRLQRVRAENVIRRQ